MAKVITTKQLQLFIGQAAAAKRNCQGPNNPIKLHPQGKHVLSLPNLHNDGDCVRVLVMAKVENQEDPNIFTLDMDLDEYNNLPDYEETV
jgi:hypothetical protein